MIVMETAFGSHLYGTATPTSDRDWKAVHIPPVRDILLQRAAATLSESSRADAPGRNGAGDVDRESWALHHFMRLLREGQMVAMDVLFSPPAAWRHAPSPLWLEILANRHRLVSRRPGGFLGYCRQQADKYGIKGTRLAAARKTVESLAALIEAHGSRARLAEVEDELRARLAGLEHVALVDRAMPDGRMITHLSVCGRMAPLTAGIGRAHATFARLLAGYGERALAAERRQGVDWKALSHAVRVGRQALELLGTGRITFPQPERAHLLAIRQGALPYPAIAAELESLLAEVEAASERSALPAEPDAAFMEEVTVEAYRAAICGKATPG